MLTKILSTATVALSFVYSLSLAPAAAAPILGSHVDSAVWNQAIGLDLDGWSYLGSSIGPSSPFAIDGRLELKLRASSYANSFGTSDAAHGNHVEIFSAGAGVGAFYDLAAGSDERLFYFDADGLDMLLISDNNRQYTDGFSSGTIPGRAQGGIDIFFHAGDYTWAFFFDDAGGGLPVIGDDNDYDDLVVTFRSNRPGVGNRVVVAEPGALGLLGAALLGMAGLLRRRKRG